MRKSSKKAPGMTKSTSVRTTMKPVFGKRSMGKRGGRGR
jgi:hypothetical protein